MLESHRWTQEANRSARVRNYLTSRSSGRRRSGGLESRVLSVVASTGDISSHKALNSASVMRLSFILRSRTATDTKCAVSALPPFASAARHSSRVARTESNRSSESNTSVSRYLTRRTHRCPADGRSPQGNCPACDQSWRPRTARGLAIIGQVVAQRSRRYHDWDIR